ncbi:MAG: acyltransferase [Bifidobacteriaceae bacterium]|nr:acyltransferase [Bifidobacteriaceae bacterium]
MVAPSALGRSEVRTEIQALRAVAVLGVALFHIWPKTRAWAGGFLGVDIFFVISGFLITSQLLREAAASGHIGLRAFWARRIRRLLPAALLVLLACVAAMLIWIPRQMWVPTLKQVAASAIYIENWVLAADSVDYFAADQSATLVQHYWSLSAEEQFYLVWPLLAVLGLWLARRTGQLGSRLSARRSVFGLMALTVAASLTYSIFFTAHSPAQAYFVTPTRAWQFGLGGLLAFVPRITGLTALRKHLPTVQAALSWLGLAMIGASFVFINETMPLPGYRCLLPVAGAMLVIWAEHSPSRLGPGRLGSPPPVQYLGNISYSLYLWHWPAVILYPLVRGNTPGFKGGLVILAGCIAASAVSKSLVEDPFRRTTYWLAKTRRSYALAAVGMTVVVALDQGLTVAIERDIEREAKIAAQLADGSYPCYGANAMMQPAGACEDDPELAGQLFPNISDLVQQDTECWTDERYPTPWKPCRWGDTDSGTATRVAVFGDSHAGYLANGALRPRLAELNWQLDVYAANECFPGSADKLCQDYWDQLVEQGYDLVIANSYTPHGPQNDPDLTGRVRQALAQLGDTPVAVVRDNPWIGWEVWECITASNGDFTQTSTCGVWQDAPDVLPEQELATAAASAGGNVTVIDLTDFYCRDGYCPAVIGHVIVYKDNHHINLTYWASLAPYLLEQLPSPS